MDGSAPKALSAAVHWWAQFQWRGKDRSQVEWELKIKLTEFETTAVDWAECIKNREME